MKENKRSIIVYFLEMLLVFLIIDFFMTIVAGGVASSTLFHKYGNDLITEIFYSFAILIVMLLFKNSYVFTEKKDNFWNGVMLAIPMLVISIYNFCYSIMGLGSFNLANFLNMIVFCIFVGIAEEFLCRGWLQNEFIERFSHNKKEIIVSIILSSLVFGCMHIVNVSFQTTFETIIQIINATTLGFLLGSIYYKTKNIWSVIFLHSFYDFSIMLGEIDMIKDCTYAEPTLSISIYESLGVLLISFLWVIGAIYVLRKCEFDEKPKKHNNNILIIIMGFIFVILLIPFNRFIPKYEDYKICYHYNEINMFDDYIIHYPNKEKYDIEYTKNDFSDEKELIEIDYGFSLYKNGEEKLVIENTNTTFKRVLEYKDIKGYEIFESKDSFNIVIWTGENESTLYVSNSIEKNNINNNNSYIKDIKFKNFVFPELSKIGYISNQDDNYVYAVSENNDEFVIIDKKLFVIN